MGQILRYFLYCAVCCHIPELEKTNIILAAVKNPAKTPYTFKTIQIPPKTLAWRQKCHKNLLNWFSCITRVHTFLSSNILKIGPLFKLVGFVYDTREHKNTSYILIYWSFDFRILVFFFPSVVKQLIHLNNCNRPWILKKQTNKKIVILVLTLTILKKKLNLKLEVSDNVRFLFWPL